MMYNFNDFISCRAWQNIAYNLVERRQTHH